MGLIDVSRHVSEMERVLRGGESDAGRLEALAVLERWQWDEMLDAPSRARARSLVREFASAGQRASGPGFSTPPLREPQRAPGAVTGRARPDGAFALRPERELRIVRRVF